MALFSTFFTQHITLPFLIGFRRKPPPACAAAKLSADYRFWTIGPRLYSLGRPTLWEAGELPRNAHTNGDPWARYPHAPGSAARPRTHRATQHLKQANVDGASENPLPLIVNSIRWAILAPRDSAK